jgi:hypothetical protein
MPQSTAKTAGLVRSEDVQRWITFTGFWGFIFYLLACVAQALASRRQPVPIHTPTAVTGLAIHLVAFVGGGSALIAAGSAVQGKRTTTLARERIGRSTLGRPLQVLGQGLGAAVGSLLPLGMAIASQRAAAQITGTPVFPDAAAIDKPRTLLAMGGLSSLVAMAITLIVGWVARDARSAVEEQQ